jgi:hypothetical protein
MLCEAVKEYGRRSSVVNSVVYMTHLELLATRRVTSCRSPQVVGSEQTSCRRHPYLSSYGSYETVFVLDNLVSKRRSTKLTSVLTVGPDSTVAVTL